MTNKPKLSVERELLESAIRILQGAGAWTTADGLRALLDKPEIRSRKVGIKPLSGRYYLAECKSCGWVGSSEECNDDCLCLQSVGNDCCYAETDEIGTDRLLELIQAGEFELPAAQHQGEPAVAIGEDQSFAKWMHEVVEFTHSGGKVSKIQRRDIVGLSEEKWAFYAWKGRAKLAEQPAPVAEVPEGYCIMPRRLTAENGAKTLLLGEFQLEVTTECPECRDLEEPLEGCEFCDGEGEYEQRHIIPWDQIKVIYSQAVAGLARNNKPL